MNFKEMIHKDLQHVFFNTNEFAEQHTLNSISVEVIIDNDRLKERSKKEYDGLYIGELLFFIPVEKTPIKLKQDMPLVFDGKQTYIFSLREDMGMYEVILNRNSGS